MTAVRAAVAGVLLSSAIAAVAADRRPLMDHDGWPRCAAFGDMRPVTSLHALPRSVIAAIAAYFGPLGGLAEAGAPYAATDMMPATPMQSHGFIRAYRVGRRWVIWYRRGGIARPVRIRLIAPTRDGSGHFVVPRAVSQGSPCEGSRALLAGERPQRRL